MKKILFLLCLLGLNFACDREDLGAPSEEFVGTYMVKPIDATIDEAKIDSLVFATQRNITYSMLFYKSSPTDQKVDFCDCNGNIIDFGTAKVSFDPTYIFVPNISGCDTLRIPRGEFAADFRNHGDTVYIEREAPGIWGIDSNRVILYQMKMIKTK